MHARPTSCSKSMTMNIMRLAAAFNIALKWLSTFDLLSNIFIKTFAQKKEMFHRLTTLCMVNTVLALPFTVVETTLTNSEGYNAIPRSTTQLTDIINPFFCPERKSVFFLNQQSIRLQTDWLEILFHCIRSIECVF